MNTVEEDFNDLVDGIVLVEEQLSLQGYEEGFQIGLGQGTDEGFQLGYTKGVQLGAELGVIYSSIVLEQTQQHSPKIQRKLEELREIIAIFPQQNNENEDIIGIVEKIRNSYKYIRVLISNRQEESISESNNLAESNKLSF